jgi:hypothetical protein
MPEDGPLAAAIADLSRDTGVDPDDIHVVANEPVTWRDGSLGCPEPGMMYTQALVDGYRIVLRAAGEVVEYHGSTGRPPFRCDHPDPNGSIGS